MGTQMQFAREYIGGRNAILQEQSVFGTTESKLVLNSIKLLQIKTILVIFNEERKGRR